MGSRELGDERETLIAFAAACEARRDEFVAQHHEAALTAILGAARRIARSPEWRPPRVVLARVVDALPKDAFGDSVRKDLATAQRESAACVHESRWKRRAGWTASFAALAASAATAFGMTRDVFTPLMRDLYAQFFSAVGGVAALLVAAGFGAIVDDDAREQLRKITRGAPARFAAMLALSTYATLVTIAALHNSVELRIDCLPSDPWYTTAMLALGSGREQACGAHRWLPEETPVTVFADGFKPLDGKAGAVEGQLLEHRGLLLEEAPRLVLTHDPSATASDERDVLDEFCRTHGETTSVAVEHYRVRVEGRLGDDAVLAVTISRMTPLERSSMWGSLVRAPSGGDACAPSEQGTLPQRVPLRPDCCPRGTSVGLTLFLCAKESPLPPGVGTAPIASFMLSESGVERTITVTQ
jgi:hypothetical protein